MDKKDGGPAFPIPIAGCSDGSVYNAIEQSSGKLGGMTLRDYFAAKELTSLENKTVCDRPEAYARIANHCYHMADAMLAERDK